MEYKIQDITELVKNEKIKIVSFDIFDTVLFRSVIDPKDLFDKIGKIAREKEWISDYINPIEFRNIRIESEKYAREKKYKIKRTKEVTLTEIYESMPLIINQEYKEYLIQLELELENEICYLNPFMQEIMNISYSLGKKIVLTSDMYLSKQQIKEILEHNGMDMNIIDDIFVSSQYETTKRDIGLYKILLSKYKLNPNEILHIGDNYCSDIMSAKELGINTFYYDVISGKKFMSLELENLAFGNIVPEIYAIRSYLSTLHNKYNEEQKKWYNIGLMVLGPLLTGLTEWTLNIAEKNNIDKILPFMREGKLFTQFLEQAIKYREKKFKVVPAYVSRKAVFLASIDKWDEKKIDEIYDIKRIRIGEIFSLLKIQHLGKPFEKFYTCILKEATLVEVNEKRLDIYLKEYLLTDVVKKEIEKIILEERKIVETYLSDLSDNKNFITLDIGFKGTIQSSIEQILTLCNKKMKNIHLLLFGSWKSINAIFKNVDLRGFVGSFGSNDDIISPIYFSPYIFEQMMMCEEGTTIGYEKDGDKIRPLKKQTISEKQIEVINICQKGALEFQKYFLQLADKKENIKKSILNAREVSEIAIRLLKYPMIEEAEVLGELEHDENFGADISQKICKKEHLILLKENGQEEFFKKLSLYDVLWWQGLVVQYEPMYFFNKLIEDTASQYKKNVLVLVKDIVNSKVEDLVIIGAGEAGQMIKKYLDLYKHVNNNIKIEAFVDNNFKLHGTMIDSVPVVPMTTKFKTNNFVIGSFAYVHELLDQIYKEKGNVHVFYHK